VRFLVKYQAQEKGNKNGSDRFCTATWQITPSGTAGKPIIEVHLTSLITVSGSCTGALPRWVNLGSQGSSPVWIDTAKTRWLLWSRRAWPRVRVTSYTCAPHVYRSSSRLSATTTFIPTTRSTIALWRKETHVLVQVTQRRGCPLLDRQHLRTREAFSASLCHSCRNMIRRRRLAP